MKVIFLDFNGVLENYNSIGSGYGDYPNIDPSCVAALNRIIRETDAKIVVSSTWRIMASIDTLSEMLDNWGVVGEVIDKTPMNRRFARRGYEIEEWIAEHDAIGYDSVESFVILDDKDDMCNLTERLVMTNIEIGLTAEDADKAINVLNTPWSGIALGMAP